MILSLVSFVLLQAKVAPNKYPGLPKYPLKGEVRVVNEGILPGSKAKDRSIREAKYTRAEYMPPAARLLIRANCLTSVAQQDAIQQAEKITTDNSPVLHIDWGKVNDKEDVSFYIVVFTNKRITKYNLTLSGETYQPTNRSEREYPEWQVVKLDVGQLGSCFREKDMTLLDLKYAVANQLNLINGNVLRNRFNDLND